MSRPSFEGFFPTAPAVIQQRKSKAALGKKQLASPPARDLSAAAVAAPEASVSAKRNEPPAETDGSRATGALQSDAALNSAQDDSESVPGDLLNGVGSASSTSTASSVFSHPRPTDAPNSRAVPRNTSTPLTNDDVSSPNFGKSPSHAKPDSASVSTAKMESTSLPEPAADVATSPTRERVPEHARPGRSESKGVKIIYDPELDKALPVKERRSRKPHYEELTGEVRSLDPELLRP